MSSLDEFLHEHVSKLTDAPSDTLEAGVTLIAILLSADDQYVTFGHYGIVFRAKRKDVLSVSADSPAIPNPFGKGIACQLVLDSHATLSRNIDYPVVDLLRHVPFAIARPSRIPAVQQIVSERETSWLQSRGIIPTASAIGAAASSFTDTTSTQWTGSYSASQSSGVDDDTYVDDQASDAMGSDDSRVDD